MWLRSTFSSSNGRLSLIQPTRFFLHSTTSSFTAASILDTTHSDSLSKHEPSPSTPPSLSMGRKVPLPLPKSDLKLPTFLANLEPSLPFPQRLREHYERVMRTDLMYLMYNHIDPENPPKFEVEMHIPGLNERNKEYKKNMKPVPKYPNLRPPPPPRSHQTIPELLSLTVSTQLLESAKAKPLLLNAMAQLEFITGHYPDLIRSKTSDILNGVREGMPIGASVTLKGDDMYAFLDKLVEFVFPKLKGWYGLPMDSDFNQEGRFPVTLEHKVTSYFPEIEQTYDRFTLMCPLTLTFKTTAYTPWETQLLLSAFQIPIETESSKARREKYDMKNLNEPVDEPEWMKFKRAKEEAEANKYHKKGF